jgi:predicted nucleotidyltransferase component of viral defense system
MSPDIAASIKARLLRLAKAQGEEFERTLVRFVSERLLFRLGASAMRERCILKGASLLAVWLPDPYRATRDVDMLSFGPADDEAIRSLIGVICAEACPEDGLRFDLSGMVVEAIRAEEEYSGMRARLDAYLGSARIRVQFDIGFGDALTATPEEIEYPTILETLPAPRLRAYPRETTVAEKFEAMVKLDTRNSRMKDFHDIWALAGAFAFDGEALRKAIVACFERRLTPWAAEAPPALTSAFYRTPEIASRWRNYLASGVILVSPPTQFEAIGERLIGFLGPIRESMVAGKPFVGHWPAGGPWQSNEESPR